MADRTILITGAGFSAPAKIPIQNQILNEMIETTSLEVMKPNAYNSDESLKFLSSYITASLYLLDKYAGMKYSEIKDNFNEFFSGNSSNSDLKSGTYLQIIELKEAIRKQLADKKIDISLEDVFTSLDKAITSGEYLENYNQFELGSIRQAIIRLFTYYISKRLMNFDFRSKNYNSFIEFIKLLNGQIGVISTNWDTLLEGFFEINRIKYDLCFSEPYFKFDSINKSKNYRRDLKLVKVHGSINWFFCKNCGMLSVITKEPRFAYLFDDNKTEKCDICGAVTKKSDLLLEPAIVTPTMVKSINNQLYRNLWNAAQNELMAATRIIFIGYSFPMADFEFRYLLQRNVKHDIPIDVVLYTNDNPNNITKRNDYLKDLLPEKRYIDAFKQNPISFHYEGFQAYFDGLLGK